MKTKGATFCILLLTQFALFGQQTIPVDLANTVEKINLSELLESSELIKLNTPDSVKLFHITRVVETRDNFLVLHTQSKEILSGSNWEIFDKEGNYIGLSSLSIHFTYNSSQDLFYSGKQGKIVAHKLNGQIAGSYNIPTIQNKSLTSQGIYALFSFEDNLYYTIRGRFKEQGAIFETGAINTKTTARTVYNQKTDNVSKVFFPTNFYVAESTVYNFNNHFQEIYDLSNASTLKINLTLNGRSNIKPKLSSNYFIRSKMLFGYFSTEKPYILVSDLKTGTQKVALNRYKEERNPSGIFDDRHTKIFLNPKDLNTPDEIYGLVYRKNNQFLNTYSEGVAHYLLIGKVN